MALAATVIWDAMGWCPMQAAPQHLSPARMSGTGKTDDTGDGGPVARRSALFMRLTWGIVILAWVAAFLALPYLPEIIPVHWNVYGEADGFSGRIVGAFGVPAIISRTMLLLMVLPRYDSVQVSLEAFRDIYAMMLFTVILLLFSVELAALASAAGTGLPIAVVMPALIGLLFVVTGALMPHLGRNTTIGIRLPWTVRNEIVWTKTHQHAGPLFMAGGVFIILASLVAGRWAMPTMGCVVVGLTLYISVWSYRLAKAQTDVE